MMRFTVVLAGMQAVALVAGWRSPTSVVIFAAIILFGATIGNILMLQPLLMAERFGVRDYPRIFSRSQLVSIVRHRRRPAAPRLVVRRGRLAIGFRTRRRRLFAARDDHLRRRRSRYRRRP